MESAEISQPRIEDRWDKGFKVYFDPESAEIMGANYCGIPSAEMLSERVWLHEFIEMFLWYKPHMQRSIGPDKGGNRNYIAHIVATICHGCFVDDTLISGDEAWERFFAE